MLFLNELIITVRRVPTFLISPVVEILGIFFMPETGLKNRL